MFLMLITLLLSFSSPSKADIDPDLMTGWKPIEKTVEKFMFPIKDYILEVKSYRPDVYNTNPSYRSPGPMTTMIVELHKGGWDNRVGRLVWNTIKYDMGRDVLIEGCDRNYKAYRSFPARGRKEQLWAWNFNSAEVQLTCNEELQYKQLFSEGEGTGQDAGDKCEALGAAPIDRIILKFMEGTYIRAVPKFGELKFPEYPTCDCWHPQCNYCTSLNCTVQHDLSASPAGVEVSSTATRGHLNTLVLYDQPGAVLGRFHWSRSRVILTGGCIQCRAPAELRRLRGDVVWNFSLQDNVVRITVEGLVVYEHRLRGQCAKTYGQVARFAFDGLGCENSFRMTEEMIAGERFTLGCNGSCYSA
ncbi:hypothetical protein ACHWQZ_G001669 [Mnemiopsis leidyi]